MNPKAQRLLKSWRQSNPKTVADLQKSGRLEQSLNQHLERESEVYGEMIEKGLNPDQARELAREELDLPPESNAD
jgi:hypothetical protein